MKPIALAFAITAVFACTNNGSQPSANAPSNQPSNVESTLVTGTNQPSNDQAGQTTTTGAQRQGVTGTNANAGASRAAGEAAPSPPKTGTEGHGLLPRPSAPGPSNTGDPCGACGKVPESH